MAETQVAYEPRRKPRKLVLCFDGTGNKFRGDDSDSNILKIYRMLDRTTDDQYHYYQPGIGTYVVSNSLSHTSLRERLHAWYLKAKDSAVGSSFDQHVVGGYRFLMRYYSPGDDIYIFGFSRGAYIARFLAEMLDHVGLLSHGNEEMVAFAWNAFSQWQCRRADLEDGEDGGGGGGGGGDEDTDPEKRRPRGTRLRGKHQQRKKKKKEKSERDLYAFLCGFRETFSRPVRRIRFLGLFDTVNSVPRFEAAWMQRSRFPYTARSSARVIRHAVSLDERRAKFRQDLIYQTATVRPQTPSTTREGKRRPLAASTAAAASEKHEGGAVVVREQNGRGRSAAAAAAAAPSTGPTLVVPDPDRHHLHHLHDGSSSGGSHDDRDASSRDGSSRTTRFRVRSRSRTTRASTSASRRSAYRAAAARHSNDEDGGGDGLYDSDEEAPQDIDEVWFAGGHGDVGGGWEIPADGKSASHVPLAWMVREAMRAGLRFDMDKVRAMGCAAEHEEQEVGAVETGSVCESLLAAAAEGGVDDDEERSSRTVPDITLTAPPATTAAGSGSSSSNGNGNTRKAGAPEKDHVHSAFHGLMHKAHTARIHDCLRYGGGLPHANTAAWRLMEYLPFRRMDLRPDGGWQPIRWPLPRGETRDVPRTARIHGSVIRRMRADPSYRPGNLIVGGGGRGMRVAPPEYGMGEWVCVAEEGDPVGEVWMRKDAVEGRAS